MRKIARKLFLNLPSPLKVYYYRKKGLRIGKGVNLALGSRIKLKEYSKSEVGDYCLLDEDVEVIAESICLGREVYILRRSLVVGESSLKVGDYSKIGPLAYLDVRQDLIIGKHVAISVGAIINSHALWHSMLEYNISKFKRVEIQDYAWIGAGAIILPGINIGKYSIVGAGAVVTRNVEPYSIVAGTPAKPIGDVRDRKVELSLEEKKDFLKKALNKFFEKNKIEVISRGNTFKLRYSNNIYDIVIAEKDLKIDRENLVVFSLIQDINLKKSVIFDFSSNRIINWRHEEFLVKLKDFLLANYGIHFEV